jgi:hypothetical protein
MPRLLLALSLLGLTAPIAAAQDPVAVSPKTHAIGLENAWARVLRIKQGPHQTAVEIQIGLK